MIREQIIKALECCTRTRKSFDDIPCRDCPHNECNLVGGTSERQTTGTCQWWLRKDALALIKELTEENERLEHICNSYALQYGTAADKEVFLKAERADTVRKMQERLKAHFDTYTDEDEETALYMRNLIDQIAKEMLEDAD